MVRGFGYGLMARHSLREMDGLSSILLHMLLRDTCGVASSSEALSSIKHHRNGGRSLYYLVNQSGARLDLNESEL
jgi:hypothetical protein